jgi:hypothetical protein
MISDEVKQLSQIIDDLIKQLKLKRITSIKSRADLDTIQGIIVNWHTIVCQLNLDAVTRQSLNDEMVKCATEISLSNPMQVKIITTLSDFNTILKREVLLKPSVLSRTILHLDIRNAMNKFENSLKDPLEITYFKEAEICLENHLFRPFIICSWNVVMFRLYKIIEKRGFNQFISAFASMFPKTSIILNALSDFYDIPDSKIIGVAASKSITPYIIDKQQKDILERNLKIRNMSAHVSENFKPAESTVLVYIDELVDTFLSKT